MAHHDEHDDREDSDPETEIPRPNHWAVLSPRSTIGTPYS